MGEGIELAAWVRRAGTRGHNVDRILALAERDLPVSVRLTRVNAEASDDVKARVMVAVWRYWIPEAKKRLKSGAWPAQTLRSKLRTALCYYAGNKAAQIAAREKAWERKARGYDAEFPTEHWPEEAGPPKREWIEKGREEQFLSALAHRANGQLSTLSRHRARAVLRLVAVVHRASNGLRRRNWTWLRLVEEFAEALADEK